MKKILLVSDSRAIEPVSIRFVCYLAKLINAEITTMLLNNPWIHNTREQTKHAEVRRHGNQTELLEKEHDLLYLFDECRDNGISLDIITMNGLLAEEIILESRYADIVVVAPDLSFETNGEDLPSSFVRNLLLNAECPVIISPKEFEKIDEVVFCYDGSSSSLFAIKQFTYLFPKSATMNCTVLEIRDNPGNQRDAGHVKTLARLNEKFNKVQVNFLQGEVKNELFTYFLSRKNICIVMGAYGRSMLSNFFRKSASDLVIKTVDLPLFIAHP